MREQGVIINREEYMKQMIITAMLTAVLCYMSLHFGV